MSMAICLLTGKSWWRGGYGSLPMVTDHTVTSIHRVNQGELEQDEEREEGEKDFHGFASILAIKARAVADAERMSATC